MPGMHFVADSFMVTNMPFCCSVLLRTFYPFRSAGFRSVPLKNQYSEKLELSSLLVHIDKRCQNPQEITMIKSISPPGSPPAPSVNGDSATSPDNAEFHRIIQAKAPVVQPYDSLEKKKRLKKLQFWKGVNR